MKLLLSLLTLEAAISPVTLAQPSQDCSVPMFDNPEYCVGLRPLSVATGDLDGDGNPDLVAGLQGGLIDDSVVVLGAFDSIYAATVPAKHPSCALALRIRFDRAEQGRHQIKLAMVDADGKSVGKFPEAVCEVKMADNQSYAVVNQIVNLIGLPLKDYGNYAIDLSIDNRHEASLPLEVRPVPQSPNAGTTDADEPWAT